MEWQTQMIFQQERTMHRGYSFIHSYIFILSSTRSTCFASYHIILSNSSPFAYSWGSLPTWIVKFLVRKQSWFEAIRSWTGCGPSVCIWWISCWSCFSKTQPWMHLYANVDEVRNQGMNLTKVFNCRKAMSLTFLEESSKTWGYSHRHTWWGTTRIHRHPNHTKIGARAVPRRQCVGTHLSSLVPKSPPARVVWVVDCAKSLGEIGAAHPASCCCCCFPPRCCPQMMKRSW